MFEPSNLVPNMNKILEEYAEGKQEVVQGTQVEVEREEVRAEERAEPEQLANENRKRKRGANKTSGE